MDQAYSKIWPQIFVFYLEVWSAAARNLAGTHHRLAILFLIAGYWLMQSKLSHLVHNSMGWEVFKPNRGGYPP